jgi:hypothetical protein
LRLPGPAFGRLRDLANPQLWLLITGTTVILSALPSCFTLVWGKLSRADRPND